MTLRHASFKGIREREDEAAVFDLMSRAVRGGFEGTNRGERGSRIVTSYEFTVMRQPV